MAILADRLKHLPPYLFARIDALKKEAVKKGVDLIDLSIGDPDMPTPTNIVEAMKRAVENPAHHRYPSTEGMALFRQGVSDWYKSRFGVSIDPDGEAMSLIGSKEGIGHIALAYINPGDIVLVPSPGYPVYSIGTLFAGGESHLMPLTSSNSFLPDLDSIAEEVYKRAKLMWLNYPNNPTSAVASREFYEKAVGLAKRHGFIICHDAAYSEIYYDGKRPMSFLEVDGAKEVGIEMHSLSKTYNMTGWRIGFACGNRDIIGGLTKVKSNLDSGAFQAVQEAAVEAFSTGDDVLDPIRATYQQRRDALLEGLGSAGIKAHKPAATFYVWAEVPRGFNSSSFSMHLLEKAGIMATPGSGFGAPGEGYIRFALTVSAERMRMAALRIAKSL